jgi:hypothetical protein
MKINKNIHPYIVVGFRLLSDAPEEYEKEGSVAFVSNIELARELALSRCGQIINTNGGSS